MEKTALDPKAAIALKILAGLSVAGGAGVGGGMIGYRKGAYSTADAMSKEFIQQNAMENQSIFDSYKAFNVKENKAIAQNAFMSGVQFAMSKQSNWHEAVVETAFKDEMEKLAGKAKMLKRLLAGVGGGLKGAAKSGVVGSAVGGMVGGAAGGKKTALGGAAVVGAASALKGAVKGARKGYLAQKATESPLYKIRGFVKSIIGGKKTKSLESWIKKNPGKTVGAGAIAATGAGYGVMS